MDDVDTLPRPKINDGLFIAPGTPYRTDFPISPDKSPWRLGCVIRLTLQGSSRKGRLWELFVKLLLGHLVGLLQNAEFWVWSWSKDHPLVAVLQHAAVIFEES